MALIIDVARHWSEAGDAERAFAAWRKAGDVAWSRNAFVEAHGAYRHALDRLAMTPPSPQRDAAELELLTVTTSMIIATLGYASPNALAEALAESTGNLGHLAEQIYGSFWAEVIATIRPPWPGPIDYSMWRDATVARSRAVRRAASSTCCFHPGAASTRSEHVALNLDQQRAVRRAHPQHL